MKGISENILKNWEQKMIIWNLVPKMSEGALWDFLTYILLQNITKTKKGTF